MSNRRIASIWFPRLAAEHMLRSDPQLSGSPFAVIHEVKNAQTLFSLSTDASRAGLSTGMGLTDARTLCPDLITRPNRPHKLSLFMAGLRRWAGKYSPWVSYDDPAGLFLDVTGCAHLFGGEEGLLDHISEDCITFRLSHRLGLADTPGAAWAMARYAGRPISAQRSGDAVDQEARATRSRSAKRKIWDKRTTPIDTSKTPRIVPPNRNRQALAPLPVEALRLDPTASDALQKLGIRTIGDMSAMPRGSLARRIGLAPVKRLDQALGAEPEPISPAKPETAFATRLSLPDPIGLYDDLVAGVERLLPPLCLKLKKMDLGIRKLRLTLFRADGTQEAMELGLARPSWDNARIHPLILLKLKDADAGYGVDMMRLEAFQTEPLASYQHTGHVEAAAQASHRNTPAGNAEFDTLLSRFSARIGLEAMTRLAPAESHIPEKTASVNSAVYCPPVEVWPKPQLTRPLILFPPEALRVLTPGKPPSSFKWRRRVFDSISAIGPERIAPEWWLDDPAWRTGSRDYWRITTKSGEKLWLFEALGDPFGQNWFVHGDFG